MHTHGLGRWLVIFGLGALLLVVLHLVAGGSLSFSWSEVFLGLIGKGSELQSSVIWQIRLPRALSGLFVGLILGLVGGVFRTYFRNPLAEPYVLGVASGSAAFAAVVILLGLDAVGGGSLMMLAGAIGGLLTLGAVWVLGGGLSGRIDVVRLLLSGVVLGSLLSAVVTLLLLLAGQDTNQVLRWLLGSLTPMYWPKVCVLIGAAILGGAILYRQTRKLNVMGFDGFESHRLGVDVSRLSMIVLGVGTLIVGLAVGSVGIVGFVGLVAPHIARGIMGPDLRRALPISGLVGACLVLLADFGAQKLIFGTELPVGVIAAILGSPFLFFIAAKGKFKL